jgi:hypothetical protein
MSKKLDSIIEKAVEKVLGGEDNPSKSTFGVDGSEIKIAILQRGWVFVGRFSQEGSRCKMTDAYNIRTWGTTKGLGELAEGGKTDSTKLDKVNDLTFHELTIVALIDCSDVVWNKILK